jgi:hypothetical protein
MKRVCADRAGSRLLFRRNQVLLGNRVRMAEELTFIVGNSDSPGLTASWSEQDNQVIAFAPGRLTNFTSFEKRTIEIFVQPRRFHTLQS